MKDTLIRVGSSFGRKFICAQVLLLLLILGARVDAAQAIPTLGNYEFLPMPAIVSLGGTVTLTMAGCVDPTATVAKPTCPAPTVLAESVTAEAGTLRQTSPTEFVYTAPSVMPAKNMVQITANYQHPFQQQVLGVVILIDPKLAGSKGGSTQPPAGTSAKKLPHYTGFVSVYIASTQHSGAWQRNLFWLDSDDSTRTIREGLGDDQKVQLGFSHMIGVMNRLEIDDQRHEHYVEGNETFDGDSEVFSFLSINLAKHLYGWQVHGDRLGDRPPSSKTYADPGFNSSCGAATFPFNPATQPYTNLNMLSGNIDCNKEKEEGYGENVTLTWYFVATAK